MTLEARKLFREIENPDGLRLDPVATDQATGETQIRLGDES